MRVSKKALAIAAIVVLPGALTALATWVVVRTVYVKIKKRIK